MTPPIWTHLLLQTSSNRPLKLIRRFERAAPAARQGVPNEQRYHSDFIAAMREHGLEPAEESIADGPIEPKFINFFQATNLLKMLMASNVDRVGSTTADERRYFVLDVSDCKRSGRDYCMKLLQAVDDAELSAFLDYLLRLDLSDFDHRNLRHTAGLTLKSVSARSTPI
jgi:hypothetical protein